MSPGRRLTALAAIAAAVATPLLVRADAAPRLPGPRMLHASAAAENARCEGCHLEIAAEWRASLHRKAHTDPAYRRALALEPLAFCRACHAPEADPDRDPPADLGAIGVGCVSCHGDSRRVLAAPRAGDSTAPHALARAPAFATASACASCHEFSFPDPERRAHKELMQSTVSEHAASPYAGVACAGCHMPLVQGKDGHAHRSHVFAASRDPALLRSAVRVSAARVGEGEVEIRLSPAGLGHAFPTGDLFRRLAVVAEAVGPEANVVAEDTRYLARRFGKAAGKGGHPIKVMLADTRVSAGADKVVRLSLGPEAKGFSIAWRVAYQRVEHPIDDEKDAAVVEGEVEIAAGVVR
jgi:hypothetical protein